ncbi:F0F1 ATP synthase subunit gamma [Azospirillum sp. ST 5-10]
MTERLNEVEARRASMEELGGVVDAMRALAAVRLQQATAALGGTRAYAGVVGDALARALAALAEGAPPPGNGHRTARGLVLFGAEHGFVGAFNDPLAERVAADGAPDVLLAAGSRAAAALEERGLRVDHAFAMATQPAGVTAVARRLADRLYDLTAAGTVRRVDLLYRRRPDGAVYRQPLFPVDPARLGPSPGAPPLLGLPAAALVERLADEYVFAQLAHAAVESFASENAARLSVMLSASQNVAERLDAMTRLERRLRQEAITAELLELVGGVG